MSGVKMRAVRPTFNNTMSNNQLVIQFEFYGYYDSGGSFVCISSEEECSETFSRLTLSPDLVDNYAIRDDKKQDFIAFFNNVSNHTKPLFTESKVGINKHANDFPDTFVLLLGFVIKNKSNGTAIETEFDCWVRAAELIGGLETKLAAILEERVN